jgi:flagellar biosynthesis protein
MSSDTSPQAPTAVALLWGGSEAPRVVAKGQETAATEIIALAKQYDIPLYEDPALAQLLCRLELDQEIPPPLYVAVAKIIAFAYYMAGRTSILGEQES